MKISIVKKMKVDVKYLDVKAGVRYWEDAKINGVEDPEGVLIPFRQGDYWEPRIDVDTGKILDWPTGITAKIHYKVCDDGVYRLLDAEEIVIKEIEGYVPDCMCPNLDGYGDYIIMNIDENGLIENYKPYFEDWDDL